jgi:hypothetical protein
MGELIQELAGEEIHERLSFPYDIEAWQDGNFHFSFLNEIVKSWQICIRRAFHRL